MLARRPQHLVALEGRPGQLRKGKEAGEFNVFVLACFALGKQLLWTMSSTSSASFTLKEQALWWCIKHLAPALAMRTTTPAWSRLCALNGTRPSLSEKGFSPN